jgi:hypothetical protein
LKGVFIMITNSATAEDRLAELGLHLPDAPTPFGAYMPAVSPRGQTADVKNGH